MSRLRELTVVGEGETDLVLERDFNAPAELVFDALTKPELLARWYGPPPEQGWTIEACEGDVRVGGAWLISLRRSGETPLVIALRGVYRELRRPGLIVTTQKVIGCESQGEDESTSTTELVARGDMTVFRSVTRYKSRAIRDAVLSSGGNVRGMSPIYERLAALLRGLAVSTD